MLRFFQSHSSAEDIKFVEGQGFWDRNLWIRGLIAFLGWGFIFMILHFREVRVDMLELSSTADRYVVAQETFEFLDEEATILLRQEAVRDIGRIYQLSIYQLQTVSKELENHLLTSREWKKIAPQSTFEEVSQIIDKLEGFLGKSRFSDARTLHRLHRLSLGSPSYYVVPTRDTMTDVELPEEEIWESFSEEEDAMLALVLEAFKGASWDLEEDLATRDFLIHRVQKQVPDKYTRIPAGRRIIDQGEKVTARHLAMLYAMKKTLNEKRKLFHLKTLFGSALLSLLVVAAVAALLKYYDAHLSSSNRYLAMLLSVVVLTVIFGKATEYFLLKATSHWMDMVRYPLIAPFAGILIASLTHVSMAAMVCFFIILLLGFSLALENQGFMMVNLITSVVAILMTGSLRQRKAVIQICAYSWAACLSVLIAFHMYEGSIVSVSFVTDAMSTGLFLLATAIFVIGLLPIFETSFHVMTDAALMEYMDPNHPILRRLSMEAPGTYQHSIVVGNLSEAAAIAIGANGLFCRVSALYHDIGKLIHPQYFTENQQGDVNMHQLLTPKESAQVIIDHVKEGAQIAQKIGLPKQFIDIIEQHHGTTLVYYFYHKQSEASDEEVDERAFRYAGPQPQTKEAAIMMVADSFEAASRSLDEITKETLTELVDKLVSTKYRDGQFDGSPLTFKELNMIKKVLVKTLLAGRHGRIKYPEQKGEQKKTKNVFQDD